VLDTDDRLQHALGLSYRYLNRADRTVSELRRHLEHRKVEAETVERTIETLTDQGFLDDARFARQFAADKREFEHWGSERITRSLLARGIEREQVEAALEEPASDETELDRALALLRLRFPSAPRDRRERDRAIGVLLRKGYDSDVALDALTAHARANE
jgi:regulatory protein